MNKIIILSFLFIGCSTSSSKTSQVENQEDSIVVDFKSSPLEVIENEIIQKPSSPNVYLKRALYYQGERKFNEALEDINRALLLAPDISFLKYHKAAILYEFAVYTQDISLLDESKIYLDNSIDEDPDIIEPRLLRAKIFLFEKKTEESMRLINDVLKIDQRTAEAYLIKGMIYHYLGNYKLATSSYQTAIEVNSDFFDAFIHMGMLLDVMGKDNALEYYNSAIAIKPNSIEAHRNKGLHLHFNEDYKSARASFSEVKRIDPSFEEAYFNIGNTFLGEYGKNEEDFTTLDSAFYYFNVAYQMNNQYVQAIHNVGLCYEVRGQIEMAKNKYKEAINLDNNFTPSLDALNALD
jgi:tetratricopeptide (TPR) repeat protein